MTMLSEESPVQPDPGVPLFEASGVSKRFGATVALENAALSLRGGEVHALMGENGAGKSTLIRVMAGVTRPDSGTFSMDGAPVQLAGPADAARLGIRFIHQELNIVPQLSVAENMHLAQAYPRRLGMFVRWGALNRRAQAVLDTLGVGYIRPTAVMGHRQRLPARCRGRSPASAPVCAG
jgi:ribose transport system ATP-binding protein